MDIINYVLILIISFLGIPIGILLSNIAIEEINSAIKYLKYLNIILISLIILIAIYPFNKIYSIILASIFLIILLISKNKDNNRWTYSSTSALLYISIFKGETLIIATLIFIYGISIVTIDTTKHFKNKINRQIKLIDNIDLIKKTLSKYSYYLLIGSIFYIIFAYII